MLAQDTPAPPEADAILSSMTLREKVGQLFIVGSNARTAEAVTLRAVDRDSVGGVFLSGRSSRGVSDTARIVRKFERRNDSELPLIVATDQEGGDVQVLSGPGFSDIPSAVTQSRMSSAHLKAKAKRWGRQLARAGVTLNLAPVADIVSGPHSGNQPIARFRREYGFDARRVSAKTQAVVDGLDAAGVAATAKHFPGLGLVHDNTDVTKRVVDRRTGRHSQSVRAFSSLIDGGVDVVMVSSARYPKLDSKTIAVFSKPIISDLLRDDLGFSGLVITDDVSSARALSPWKPGTRAVKAISAGVDLVLVSAQPSLADDMIDAVVKRAKRDEAFAARVDESAKRVIAFKLAQSEN
jgi:beta-N-acetylhexosaminidase